MLFSNSVDVITKGRVCSGSVSSPNIAGAPGGEIFGWSAALLSSGTKVQAPGREIFGWLAALLSSGTKVQAPGREI